MTGGSKRLIWLEHMITGPFLGIFSSPRISILNITFMIVRTITLAI